MSGAGIRCCRICGHALESQADRQEGVTLEFEEWCPGCKLFRHDYAYGSTVEEIGVIVSAWSYTESGPGNWREQEAEAKRLYASDTAMGLVRRMRDEPDAETPRKVLADWCDDNGCPLSAAYLRGA